MTQTTEDRNYLFSAAEKKNHQEIEGGLIAKAKSGNFNPLFNFWAEKRKLFLQRAFERSPYAKGA